MTCINQPGGIYPCLHFPHLARHFVLSLQIRQLLLMSALYAEQLRSDSLDLLLMGTSDALQLLLLAT